MLELRGAGEVVGELGAIDGQTRSASVIALGEVEALVLPVERFNALLRERVGLAHRLLVTVVARVREASGRQLELGTADVVGRVCRRLAELAKSHGVRADDGVLVAARSRSRSWPTGRACPVTVSCGPSTSCAASAGWRPAGSGC